MQSSRLYLITLGALSLGASREPSAVTPRPSGSTPSPEH